jgi:hypothetical protein
MLAEALAADPRPMPRGPEALRVRRVLPDVNEKARASPSPKKPYGKERLWAA